MIRYPLSVTQLTMTKNKKFLAIGLCENALFGSGKGSYMKANGCDATLYSYHSVSAENAYTQVHENKASYQDAPMKVVTMVGQVARFQQDTHISVGTIVLGMEIQPHARGKKCESSKKNSPSHARGVQWVERRWIQR